MDAVEQVVAIIGLFQKLWAHEDSVSGCCMAKPAKSHMAYLIAHPTCFLGDAVPARVQFPTEVGHVEHSFRFQRVRAIADDVRDARPRRADLQP